MSTGPTPTSTSNAAAKRAHAAAIDQGLHAETFVRFRRAVLAGTLMWPLFAGVDLLALSTFARHVDPWRVLGPRAFFAVAAVGYTVWLFRQKSLTPRVLLAVDQSIYTLAAFALGLMALNLGGLVSPYLPGACLVITARMFSLPFDLKRALAANAAPALVAPLTVLVGVAVTDSLRPQLHDTDALGTFALSVAYLLGTAGFMSIGSNIVFTLRTQLSAERSIGRYRLRKRLGAGGMGEVWAAWHSSLKRDVALKILKAREADPTAAARFEREVQATSELTHPNTVRVFDYGATDDGLLYYAMELLRGEDLSALVKRDGALPPERAVHLVRQATRALAEAHARGIVHRDVKPENLFVTAAGGEGDFVKVLDFGIARIETSGQSAEAELKLTSQDEVVGTPRYMAPEAMRGEQATARADVYGLGAVLYLTLVGRPPFDAPTRMALVGAVLSEAPAPGVAQGSAELVSLVARALKKDPLQRFADAAELSDALEAVPEAGRWKPARTALAWEPPATAPDAAEEAKATPVKGTHPGAETVTVAHPRQP